MPSVLLLHRLPPSKATLSLWSLLGRYQVSIKGFRILCPICSYVLPTFNTEDCECCSSQDKTSPCTSKGNIARTRMRRCVVLWPQPPLLLQRRRLQTRNQRELLFGYRILNLNHRSKKCDPEACELPWCYCSPTGSEIPGGLQVEYIMIGGIDDRIIEHKQVFIF